MPATEAQQKYILSLLESRKLEGTKFEDWTPNWDKATVKLASQVISELKGLPMGKLPEFTTTEVDVPAGRYALQLDGRVVCYQVDKPVDGRWQGYTFVKRFQGKTKINVRNVADRTEILKLIAQDPQGAMLRYGRETVHCGHCGRQLTNDESKKIGIGPICREKMGW